MQIRFDGRIAQLVEQLTLNQRVHGSSPCAPTIEINELADVDRRVASQKSPLGSTWETRAAECSRIPAGCGTYGSEPRGRETGGHF
jgi:hypothetical protein